MASIFSRFSGLWSGSTTTKAAAPAPVSAERIAVLRFLMSIGGEISARDAWNLYKSVGTLGKTVDLIADNVAGLKPVVKIGDDIYDAHPVTALLNRPGYSRSRRRYIKELAVQQLVTGTAYAHLVGSVRAAPTMLDHFRSKDVTILEDQDGFPRRIQVNESRRTFNFDRQPGRDLLYLTSNNLSQVVPIYDAEGDMRGVGLSRLQSIRDEVELKLTGTIHNRSLMENGARPSGIVSFKERLTQDDLANVRADIRAMSGPGGAGSVAVASGGDFDFKQLSQSLKDMDWANLIKLVDQTITDRYSVPSTLFTSDAQTYSNYSEAWRALYDQAVLPTFQIIYSGLAEALSARYGEEIEIVHDARSNEILADQAADRAIKLHSAQLITANEARDMIGMEPVIGGDEILGPMGMATMYQDAFDENGDPIDHAQPPNATAAPSPKAGAGGPSSEKALPLH